MNDTLFNIATLVWLGDMSQQLSVCLQFVGALTLIYIVVISIIAIPHSLQKEHLPMIIKGIIIGTCMLLVGGLLPKKEVFHVLASPYVKEAGIEIIQCKDKN